MICNRPVCDDPEDITINGYVDPIAVANLAEKIAEQMYLKEIGGT